MSIHTIYAHVSCSDIAVSEKWYTRIFARAQMRRPMPKLVEWQFSSSAAVQLYQDHENAGRSALTIGVESSLELERQRLVAAQVSPGPIEPATGLFIMRLRDPDDNLVVFVSAVR